MRRRLISAALVAAVAAALSITAVTPSIAGSRSKARYAKALPDIRIGLLLAGGPYAAVADDIASGLELAILEAGRSVDRRHLVVVREDGNGDPADAATRAGGLAAAAAVDVLVGPATQGEIGGLRDVADERQIPLIVPVSSAADSTASCSPYVFHLVPSDDQVAGLLGAWVAGRKPAKRVYVLVPQDKAGRAKVAAFDRQYDAAGGALVGQESVTGSNPEFSPYLAKLRLVGADTIYAPFTETLAKTLTTEFDSLGLGKRVAFVGGEPAIATREGEIEAVDYVANLDSPANRRFRAEFAKRYGRPASAYAARGYDAGRLIIDAVRSAHGEIGQSGDFAALLAQVGFIGPRGPVRGAALEQLYIVHAPAASAPGDAELMDRVEPTAPAPADACHMPARS